MITHDELIYCIQQVYPGAVHGPDFLVGHEIDEETDQQKAPAKIYRWSMDAPQPDEEAVDALIEQYGDQARVHVLATYARQQRDHMLRESDGPYLRAQERGEDVSALLSYRNALRDLPEQPGFPETIVWPELPAA